jgi:hypothetical protein
MRTKRTALLTSILLLALSVLACGPPTAEPATQVPPTQVPPTQPPPPTQVSPTQPPPPTQVPPTQPPPPTAVPPTQPPPPTQVPPTQPPPPTEAPSGLEYWRDPTFGSANLSPGFWPDPQTVSIVSGGNVDVWSLNLGSGCGGYAATAPDFRIQLSDASSRLRIFFVADGGEDTTLIVNTATAAWRCNDDSAGTLNPMVEIQNAPAGQYDVWVGSFVSGDYIAGNLYITELSYDPSDFSGGPPPPTEAPSGLEYWRDPTFGSVNLSPGFWPDPQTVSLVSGGNVDVWSLNLGSGCIGYAATAPDFRIRLSDVSSRLRIFFVADGGDDTTLIVNTATAAWRCNDDSAGTLDPMVEIQNAPAGQYDVWVGSFVSGDFIAGNLYITELSYDPSDY